MGPLASGFQVFWWKVCWLFYWYSLIHDMCLLSCSFQDSLCLSNSWLKCVSVWMSLSSSSWSLLRFLDVYIQDFHQLWGIFKHYFFKYFYCHFLFWDSQMCMLVTWCPICPFDSVHFSLIFFSFCSLDSILSMILSLILLILSLAFLNLSLNPSHFSYYIF